RLNACIVLRSFEGLKISGNLLLSFQATNVFISPKLDHPFRSKLNHPELPVKEGVKIGLIFG
ncbi:MAG: hypothetical protein ACKOPU_05995, partial [Candidatus Planktophila sp.]